MGIRIFDQWPAFVTLIRQIAHEEVATVQPHRPLVGAVVQDGMVHLANHARHNLVVAGGTTELVMPASTPDEARELIVRITARGESHLIFTGADAFEGTREVLNPLHDGETAVFIFREMATDIFHVTRACADYLDTSTGDD